MTGSRDRSVQNGSLKLNVEERPKYLYAFIEGHKDTVEESTRHWTTIAERCAAKSYDKVMIEEKIEVQMPFLDIYEFATLIADLGFRKIRLAYVNGRGDHHSGYLFGETVAFNRGVVAKVFLNSDEAEVWLLADGAAE